MSTSEFSSGSSVAADAFPGRRVSEQTLEVTPVLTALASLRLTVTLFALSIFLIFMGTLAQVDHDIWHVVNNTYFRVWFAWVEWRAFVRLIDMVYLTGVGDTVTGGFYFPGGKLIGTLLFANLIAAHSIRFKASAKGQRLFAGLVTLALGVVATVVVIVSGMDNAIESQLSAEFCRGLWHALRACLAGVALAGAYWVTTSYHQMRRVEWWTAATLVASIAAVATWLLLNPGIRIDDAGLRILWQITKAAFAAALLLVGCWIVFKKRAGMVLLHAGIGLLMAGELITDLTAQESQMSIAEGETVNFTYDIRTTELALSKLDASTEKPFDRVTVVPQNVLSRADSKEAIEHPELPFDVRVVDLMLNSYLRPREAVAPAGGIEGVGKQIEAVEAKSVSGVAGGSVNRPSAYVELIDKTSQESIGTYLVSASADANQRGITPQPIEYDGERYTLELRFKRVYKPYAVTLKDFRFDRYVATGTPKNYSSLIQLEDPNRQVDREVKIWMNNPLRYGGDTLYQSGFDELTEQTTVLQVVSNTGWMIPYVSCVLVAFGMFAHFGISLTRFTRRRNEEAQKAFKKQAKSGAFAKEGGRPRLGWSHPSVYVPVLAAVVMGGYLLSKARPVSDADGAMQIQRFGALPVADGGRVKPMDTLARNTLQYLSARQEVKATDDTDKKPAIEWLLGVIADPQRVMDDRVFRIESLEVLETLDLERRPGSFRYSYNEVMQSQEELGKQLRLVGEVTPKERSLYQKQIAEIGSKVGFFKTLANTFGEPRFSGNPDNIQQEVQSAAFQAMTLRRSHAPRAVPPRSVEEEWKTYFEGDLDNLLSRVRQKPLNPAVDHLGNLLNAYRDDDTTAFNESLDKLEAELATYEAELNLPSNAEAISGMAFAERLNIDKVRFEQFFNQFSPFYYCAVSYLVAFVLCACSWLGASKPLSRAALAVILITLLVHTFALVGRIYISGRPPVTNLYSSAVFIGWGAVVFAVLLEAISKIGVGSVVASVTGFSTLLVAHFLSQDGDTFTVLQAVLDTQFWLATHVVCITLGYSATFLAGAFGAVYLIGSKIGSSYDAKQRQQIIRMTYGTLCFAIFFSFIGTVLGGLWADDSWGRFWGWDPKENGALIIVLWNALVLHARWGKMVKENGLAVLAVAGNIMTAWSWFGVNELGVGLHSYGFTEGRSFWLLIFAISQLAVMALAWLPTRGPTQPTSEVSLA